MESEPQAEISPTSYTGFEPVLHLLVHRDLARSQGPVLVAAEVVELDEQGTIAGLEGSWQLVVEAGRLAPTLNLRWPAGPSFSLHTQAPPEASWPLCVSRPELSVARLDPGSGVSAG